MLTFRAFGYTFEVDGAGAVTSRDADAATLRTLIATVEDNAWRSGLAQPYAAYEAVLLYYGPERVQLVEAPELDTSGVTGEVMY